MDQQLFENKLSIPSVQENLFVRDFFQIVRELEDSVYHSLERIFLEHVNHLKRHDHSVIDQFDNDKNFNQ